MKRFMPLMVAMAFVVTGANADYVGYIVKDSARIPMPEVLDPVPVEDLFNVEWGTYSGPRARIAVLPVDNTSGASSVQWSDGAGRSGAVVSSATMVPVNGIEAIVTDILNRTNRFRLVERVAVGAVLGEQDLGAAGRVAAPSAAQVGSIAGAQFLVQVVVTHYEADVSGRDVGVGGLLGGRAGAVLGGMRVTSKNAAVGINLRVIDATTSEILFTRQINREISESGVNFGGGGFVGGGALGGFVNDYSRLPIGQVMIATLNEAAFELVKQVGNRPTAGAVIRNDNGRIFINLGQGLVNPGDRLQVWRKGEDLIDPETGLSLGSDDELAGELTVVEVRERFSIASAAGGYVAAPGDRVISTDAAQGLEFGPPYTASREDRRRRR